MGQNRATIISINVYYGRNKLLCFCLSELFVRTYQVWNFIIYPYVSLWIINKKNGFIHTYIPNLDKKGNER